MDRKYVLGSAIDDAKLAIETLQGWMDTLERGRKGMGLGRKDMLNCIKLMQMAGLEQFVDRKLDDVFEAMTGERP